MIKKLTLGAAIGALMVSGALAQSPNPPASPSSSPPASSSSPAAGDKAGGKADVVTSQKPDQWVASKFKGTEVVGSDNKKIGDVSDILFDKSGKIEAYVVAVGGFLGMGSKEVALAPSSFEVVPGTNGAAEKLKISMSADQLKQAQNFARYEPPRPTTSGSGGGLNSLSGGGMRPSSNMPPTGK
jgi:sporulation protein YlmC with PRC-barrel domain